MRAIRRYAGSDCAPADSTLRLPYDIRKKSRFKAVSTAGEDFGVILPRGRVLRDGDCLLDERGQVVLVQAAPEHLSTAATADPGLLARAAYHLGNRHVPLQIGAGWLRYQHDHVLDAMARGLGLEVAQELLPFEPEPGAYAGHHHPGGDPAHDHDHDHHDPAR